MQVSGVYGIAAGSQIIYVGQSIDISDRIDDHCSDHGHCMWFYNPDCVFAERVDGRRARLLRERELIAEYDPICNQD